MSIPQARINMSETEHDTTFESHNIWNLLNVNLKDESYSTMLGKTFGFILFRWLENTFAKLSFPLHNAVIIPPM